MVDGEHMSHFRNLGILLKTARSRKKLSQNELGIQINSNRSIISKWECGRLLPKNNKVALLMKVLRIEKTDILNAMMKDHNEALFGQK